MSTKRRARTDLGQFVIDGATLVAEALTSPVELVAVYAEPDAPADILAAVHAAGVTVVDVAADALRRITSPQNPQPMAACARIPALAPPEPLCGLVLVLDNVNDPGNGGTSVRIAEAVGATAVVCTGDGADPWNPKFVRASAGSSFRVPVRLASQPHDLLRRCSERMRVVTTEMDGGSSPDQVDLTGDVCVVVGNEVRGVSGLWRSVAHDAVTIPMAGRVESLNAAVAAAVVGFESARQRRVPREA